MENMMQGSRQVFMAHVGLTWPQGPRGFQRYARGGDHDGEAQATVRAQPYAAWLDAGILRSTGDDWLPLEVRARQDDHALALRLRSDRPLVLQGEDGFSQKHPAGGGSHYYSQPFLAADGWVEIGGRRIDVTGQAWLDREWSSQFLQPDQQGWDWFALHLDSGEKLMLFRLRPMPGTQGGAYRHGVLIRPTGDRQDREADAIEFEVVQRERVAGRELPLAWRVALPTLGRELRIEALRPDQWMDVDFPYWEGAVRVEGNGPGSRGMGYMELTGYPPTAR